MPETYTITCTQCDGTGHAQIPVSHHTMTWCGRDPKHEVCIGQREVWEFGRMIRIEQCDCQCHSE